MSDAGSDGSPRRPLRRIRRVIVASSSSESGSDDSVGPSRTRKKRLRVASESSSGSSVVAAGARRRAVPGLRDSDVDSDTSSGTSLPEAPQQSSAKLAAGFSSDSSDGNSEKCSICLLRFRDQEVGTPSTCEHTFCLDCITEWSRNVNTCPVDRLEFEGIVVRAGLGGDILRVCPVAPRPPSVDLYVVEDPTHCEVCGSAEREATMLLCDRCDLAYHMECLHPPLQQVPVEQWFCPRCVALQDDDQYIYLSEVDDLLMGIQVGELDMPPRPLRRRPRNVRTSERDTRTNEEPSTSNGRTSTNRPNLEAAQTATLSLPSRTRAKKYKRRRRRTKRKTVLIEYEVQGDGKFPITKNVTIKKRIRKRKSKRPRTAARRAHVRASVRARLRALLDSAAAAPRRDPGLALCSSLSAHPALPAPLRLFGDRNQLDYFSDDEVEGAAVAAGPAAASRMLPASQTLAAYRQARRKMISIPSPPRATSSTDLLSSILESQTLLHSRRGGCGRVDVTEGGGDSTRKVPAHPGQGRGGRSGSGGGGGWGGGYRGHYSRERHGPLDRTQHYPARAQPPPSSFGTSWREEGGPASAPEPRGPRAPRPAWRPYADEPKPRVRNSFGGFENPLDMRTRQDSATPESVRANRAEDVRREGPPHSGFRPLPEPPVFRFDRIQDADRSEDERSDSGLVIDTEKYDPTEPTRDDSSGDDEGGDAAAVAEPSSSTAVQRPIHNILAGIDALNVTSTVLDKAVKQVLQEHNLIMPSHTVCNDKSDDESDGDCPNFSIYSATSVHIANNPSSLISKPLREHTNLVSYPMDEDLVQEDDDTPPSETNIENQNNGIQLDAQDSASLLSSTTTKPVDYNERVSKRCPITPNKRNPIKIKLNTPTLIKRQVTLYDEEDVEEEYDNGDTNADVSVSSQEVTLDSIEMKQESKINKNMEQEKLNILVKTPESNIDEFATDSVNSETFNKNLEDQSGHKNIGNDDEEQNGCSNTVPTDEENSEKDLGISLKDDERQTSEPEQPSDQDDVDISDNEVDINHEDSRRDSEEKEEHDQNEEVLEKMTESISETEDERSYTPCLDENKSKDTSLETEKENMGIEGLDTEMISEEEGNEIFSDADKLESEKSGDSPSKEIASADREDGEILEKRKELADLNNQEDSKKKKKKESRKEGKDKSKVKSKKTEVAFKKLSKNGKERNYRDKDKESKSRNKRGRHSSSEGERDRKKKEKRKDLERYDVRTLVTEKRRRVKDAFGRDISPGRRTLSPSVPRSVSGSPAPALPVRPASRSRSPSPRADPPPRKRSLSRRRRKSVSPRPRRSPSRVRKPSLRRRRSLSRGRKRQRRSPSRSPRPKPTKKKKRSRSRPRSQEKEKRTRRARRKSKSPRRKSPKQKKKKKKSRSPELELSPERCAWRGSSPSPAYVARAWSPSDRSIDSRLLSPGWTPPPEGRRASSRAAHMPHTPHVQHAPHAAHAPLAAPRRLKLGGKEVGASKEVFTSGDNILVSVSFEAGERGVDEAATRRRRRKAEAKRERRERRRRKAAPESDHVKPVAIIDLDGSPFREITPSPKHVIVLSDSDHADPVPPRASPAASALAPAPSPSAAAAPPSGPKTPPSPAAPDCTDPAAPAGVGPLSAGSAPSVKFNIASKPTCTLRPAANPLREEECPPSPSAADTAPTAAAATAAPPSPSPSPPPSPPSSRDAYDPFEPTKSPEPTPATAPPTVATVTAMTLEAAQRTNMSADDVLNQRPVSPMEKVLALLQSTRDVSPTRAPSPSAPATHAPAPTAAAAPRVLLPGPQPKLFLAKPSPIKSTPIKPMPAARPPPPPPAMDSPYSPGSSDFGDLFSPPAPAERESDAFELLFGGGGGGRSRSRGHGAHAARVPVKQIRKKGNKTQVGVKLDEDNLKILDDLPSSAVEMQVKSKFLKKLNRQERVVEEVKLVLKPHYNKKRLSKEEYKDILRRCVPKICHNKTGEINPAKIQALVEAYVRKLRKKRKLGLI